jgi:DNA-binding response OmpR family regulator
MGRMEDVDVLLLAGPAGADRGWHALVDAVKSARDSGYSGAIFVLSTKAGPHIERACLRAGADDFVTTTRSSSVFTARLERLVAWRQARVIAAPVSRPALQKLSVKLDRDRSVLRIDGTSVKLSRAIFRVVACLIRTARKWVSAMDLQKEALGVHAAQRSSNVRVHVHGARRALGPYEWFLHSSHDGGYMWSIDPCDEKHCQEHLLERASALGLTAIATRTTRKAG